MDDACSHCFLPPAPPVLSCQPVLAKSDTFTFNLLDDPREDPAWEDRGTPTDAASQHHDGRKGLLEGLERSA